MRALRAPRFRLGWPTAITCSCSGRHTYVPGRYCKRLQPQALAICFTVVSVDSLGFGRLAAAGGQLTRSAASLGADGSDASGRSEKLGAERARAL